MTASESNFAQPTYGNAPIQNIIESPYNPRKRFSEAYIAELAESVKTVGILQPIFVRPMPTTEQQIECFEIVFGHCRFRAAKLAGLTHVPVKCQELTDAEVMTIQLIENLQREDVSELEEAEGYDALMKELKMSAVQIAAKVGKSKEYIYGRLKLCALTPANRELFYAGKLTASTALLVARIPVATLQDRAGEEITDDTTSGEVMSARAAQRHITSRYTLSLASADFDIKDAKLVKSAGACTKCPKRTGAQPEIYPELLADVCTDPDCFASKNRALADKTPQTTTKAVAHVLTERHGEHPPASTKHEEIVAGINAASDGDDEQNLPVTVAARDLALEQESKVRLDVYMSIRDRNDSRPILLRCIAKSMLGDFPLPTDQIEYSFDTSSDEAICAHIDQMTDEQELLKLIADITFGYALNSRSWYVNAKGIIDLDSQSYRDLASTAQAFGIDIDQIRESHKPVVAESKPEETKPKGKASKKAKAVKVVEPEPEYPADDDASKSDSNPTTNRVADWPYPTSAQMAAKEAA